MAKAKVKWTGNEHFPERTEFVMHVGDEAITFPKDKAVEIEAEHARGIVARPDFVLVSEEKVEVGDVTGDKVKDKPKPNVMTTETGPGGSPGGKK